MLKIWKWLNTETIGLKRCLKLILVMLLLRLLTGLITGVVFGTGRLEMNYSSLKVFQGWHLVGIMAFFAFSEEVAWRLFPVFISARYTETRLYWLPLPSIFAVFFGVIHIGNVKVITFGQFWSLTGYILDCFIAGILLLVTFLKAGGFQRRWFKSLSISSLTHFLFNVPVLIVWLYGS